MSEWGDSSKRIVFFGTPELSARYLKALLDNGLGVVSVVTRPPKRRGRGSALSPSPVEELAHLRGLQVLYSFEHLKPESYDLGLVVAYGRIIPEAIVNSLPLINVHYSLLPKYRGAAPMQWAILSGDHISGVTLMRIRKEMDSGEVYAQEEVEIDRLYLSELAKVLTDRGIKMVLKWFMRSDDWISKGVAQSGDVSYAPKLEKDTFFIKWDRSATEIERVVRLERAYTLLNSRRLQILKGHVVELDVETHLRPGSVVRDNQISYVVCNGGGFAPEIVKPEGSKEMSFEAFLQGHRELDLSFS